jgi:hypothetical protein
MMGETRPARPEERQELPRENYHNLDDPGLDDPQSGSKESGHADHPKAQ